MDTTSNLNLPFIMAAQAQKHVTHNEALRALDAVVQLMVLDKDLASPPGSPGEGARYIVAASPTGAWSGQAGKIAAFQDGAWAFYAPAGGLAGLGGATRTSSTSWSGAAWGLLSGGGGGGLADVVDDTSPQLGGDLDTNAHNIDFDNAKGITGRHRQRADRLQQDRVRRQPPQATKPPPATRPSSAPMGDDTNIDLKLAGKGSGHPKADLFGVNATADTTTRFVVAAAASLFDHAGNGHQHKINKTAAGDTASLLFQTGTSGRAEMGTRRRRRLPRQGERRTAPPGRRRSWSTARTGAARFPGHRPFSTCRPAARRRRRPAARCASTPRPTRASTRRTTPALGPAWPAGGGGSGGVNPNLLINPDGRIDQVNAGAAATTADDAYGSSDCWYALTQTAAITVQRLADGESGMPFYQQLKQTQATAQRMGRAQIIESGDCRHARGQGLVLSGRIRCSSAQAIRYAILEWTGTADAVTSDVVNSWTNGTFTAGQFFNSTTLNVLGVGALTPSANTWTDLTPLSATAGASLNNLIVLIWTEGTAAQNVTLDFRLKLEVGASATAFVPRTSIQELLLCQRFFFKSWEAETAVGAATAAGQLAHRDTLASSTFKNFFLTRTPVPMRATPAITWYSPVTGASGQVRHTTASADVTVSSTTGGSAVSTGFPVLGAGTGADGDNWNAHVTLDARL